MKITRNCTYLIIIIKYHISYILLLLLNIIYFVEDSYRFLRKRVTVVNVVHCISHMAVDTSTAFSPASFHLSKLEISFVNLATFFLNDNIEIYNYIYMYIYIVYNISDYRVVTDTLSIIYTNCNIYRIFKYYRLFIAI